MNAPSKRPVYEIVYRVEVAGEVPPGFTAEAVREAINLCAPENAIDDAIWAGNGPGERIEHMSVVLHAVRSVETVEGIDLDAIRAALRHALAVAAAERALRKADVELYRAVAMDLAAPEDHETVRVADLALRALGVEP